MRRFVTGVVVGLLLAGVPSVAEWDYGDMTVLKELTAYGKALVEAQKQAAVDQKRIADAAEWQARSLQRLVWVAERQFPAPPERK